MRKLNDKIYDELKKSRELQQIALGANVDYEKGQEIRKVQNEHYNKWLFFKNLKGAMLKK